MAQENQLTHAAFIHRIPLLASTLAIGVALMVLAGWTFQMEALTSLLPGWPTTKASTAVCLLLSGLALRFRSVRWTWVLALLAAAVGVVSAAESLFGWDAGIDALFFTDEHLATHAAGPGRLAVNTAIALALLGAALLLMSSRDRRLARAAEVLGGLVALITIFWLVGLVVGADTLTGRFGDYSAMAIPTGATLLALAIGVVLAVPDGWFAQRITSRGPDGTVMRGLMPIAVVVPILLAWLRVLGQNAGWYEMRFGVTLFTSGTIALVASAGFWIVAALERESRERLAAETALAESEERQRMVVDGARIGMWFWDVPTDNLVWTPVCRELFGVDPGQAMSYAVFEAALHPDDRARTREAVECSWRDRADFRMEYRAIWHDGSEHWLAAHGRSWFDAQGNVRRMMGVVHDIDERKRVQLELERSNAELERFAYVASHDLKEPLRTVSSFTSLLQQRYQGRLDADADEFVRFIVDGVERMQRLVDELLVYSRVRNNEMRMTRVSTEDVLGAALNGLQHAVTESAAIITHETLPEVQADAAQLERVFANLLGNAIKFRRGRAPRIRVGAKRVAGEWVFSVADDGIGIDARHFDRIFGLFRRLHSQSTYPGTGLGLAIAKLIVERHRGRIWVESKPQQGATFHFTLPAMNERSGKAADVS